jgi:hypothetical protein
MHPTSEVRTPQAQTDSGHPAHTASGRRPWRFLRHYLEMVAAMAVGMIVVGAAVRGGLALAGLEFPSQYAELAVLEMAVDMSVGMVAWMRYRGHSWALTLEMVGAMFVPAIALCPLLWAGVISGGSLILLEHVVMLPLMYLVMLRRRNEYGGSSHG